ncbi:sugar phosphate isomerase/epimerase family protein [Paenibacillus soyae]|uniref:Sugar phosphate isomerase/epimerase n=1 Tax=Paenibacillus soyae TaxID=2969249 RepID=A0A9X2MSX3_9BACL|nr:sugar phosphate isomerase/epimerase [Paenibacillus soyae]MCR2805682.1 sugar phosphate isomerase/epimerase [Paenibacillus soyae]
MSGNITNMIKNKDLALDVQMSWWTMNGFGRNGREWTKEEKVAAIAEAGFNGINGFVPSQEEASDWRNLMERYELSFGVNAYPKSTADLRAFLENVKQTGGIDFVNAQVLTPFLIDESAEKLLSEMLACSAEYRIPVYIETHRGTITQDLIRTANYVKRLGRLPLTIDFSHYVVAGEMHSPDEEADRLLSILLEQTSSIHARISNGEQVQVGIGENGEHPIVPRFKQWWRKGMSDWVANAEPKSKLPVVCELGPAPYAITIDEHAGRTQEISDRWQQSLLLKNILKGIWEKL